MSTTLPTLAIVGGTGALGRGLAKRWAARGYPIVIGSRSAERAEAAAQALMESGAAAPVRGLDNASSARAGDIVVITVPYANHGAILAEIKGAVAGKIVVDATVPLTPPKVARVQLPPEGSAAQAAQELLGEDVQLVAAFHNVAAHKLAQDVEIDCDVLVCGDQVAAREAVVTLVEALGLRGLHGGPLANAAAAEALTSVLIGINKRYKVDGVGIRITGLAQDQPTGES
ncbi:MAG: NADPH-dependent F420 reductase [Alphaproteobacteria bacterium]